VLEADLRIAEAIIGRHRQDITSPAREFFVCGRLLEAVFASKKFVGSEVDSRKAYSHFRTTGDIMCTIWRALLESPRWLPAIFYWALIYLKYTGEA